MLKSDFNLTPEEYLKFFITDVDTARHFKTLIDDNEYLRNELDQSTVDADDIYYLKEEIDELNYKIDLKEIEIRRLKLLCNSYYGFIHEK